MEKRRDLYKEGKLNLVYIAGGEFNLNACIAGQFRRHIAKNYMSIGGLIRLVEIKEGITDAERIINAIQEERLKEVKAEDAKRIFSAIGLRREDYFYLPLVEIWRDALVEEMTQGGYADFSDESIREYMTDRILADLCKK